MGSHVAINTDQTRLFISSDMIFAFQALYRVYVITNQFDMHARC
jgi:hypothetical protein